MKKAKFLLGAVIVVGAIDAALAYRNYLKKKGIDLKAAFLKAGNLHHAKDAEDLADEDGKGHDIPIDWKEEEQIFAD